MEQIKLEVGRKFQNRRGEVITIVKHDPIRIHEFWGDDDESYTENGIHDQFHKFDPPNPKDLVKEVLP